MNFAHPRVLWVGLALLPLLALFFWYTWRKRQELIAIFVQNKALAQLALGVSVPRQKLRRVILFLGVAFLLLGMAGPRWGFTWEEAAQRGRDIIVAIDTSRSMLATDVQPDRLTRAKLAALDLLKLGKFDRFGLIAFAGTAFLQSPLTFDDEAFRQSVQILQPGIIPQGGTALSEAIKTARDAFGTDAEENHKILILFTDGEDHEAGVKEAAERAAGEGVRIFTVGVGTAGGELLRVRDEQGNQVYVKDESGNVVKSRLDEELLREVATIGKGFYLPLQGGNAMDVLYQRGLAPLPTSERNSKLMKQLKEQFYWPLGLGILLLVLELFIPEQKRAARKPSPAAEPKTVSAAAVAALLLFMLIPQVHASAAKAQRQYNAHEYKSSLSEYQDLLAKKPDDPRLHYNAGAAAYQATKFDEAVKQFEAAAASPDLDLQQQSFYNLGNAEFRVGEADSNPQQRTAIWEQAVQHYDAALKLHPQDKDAEFNRDLVKKKLEELKKQQQQEKKDKNQENNKDDKNKDDKQDQKDKDKQQQDNKSDQEKKQDQQNNQSDKDKQDQGKQQQDKKQDQQQQQEQQQQQGQDKQDQSKQDQANSQQGKDSQGKPEGEDTAAQYAQLGKMSPAQAKQLLDAQRGEEKALLFIPQDKKANAQNRVFKDW
jgi:Ca-activated chloride channel family protein